MPPVDVPALDAEERELAELGGGLEGAPVGKLHALILKVNPVQHKREPDLRPSAQPIGRNAPEFVRGPLVAWGWAVVWCNGRLPNPGVPLRR